MRCLVSGFAFLFLTSCGDSGRPQATPDSVPQTEYSDSTSYLNVVKAVSRCDIPVLLDSVQERFPEHKINKRISDDLLPPDFDYAYYREVSCVAKAKIGVIPVLWFKLVSEGEYDESPPAVELLMVLYDCNYQPIDVYNVQYSDIGYSRSYVRADSVFTISVDEMEDINITTTAVAIGEKGFVVGPSETKTFDSGEKGYGESVEYKRAYFRSKGVTFFQ